MVSRPGSKYSTAPLSRSARSLMLANRPRPAACIHGWTPQRRWQSEWHQIVYCRAVDITRPQSRAGPPAERIIDIELGLEATALRLQNAAAEQSPAVVAQRSMQATSSVRCAGMLPGLLSARDCLRAPRRAVPHDCVCVHRSPSVSTHRLCPWKQTLE